MVCTHALYLSEDGEKPDFTIHENMQSALMCAISRSFSFFCSVLMYYLYKNNDPTHMLHQVKIIRIFTTFRTACTSIGIMQSDSPIKVLSSDVRSTHDSAAGHAMTVDE